LRATCDIRVLGNGIDAAVFDPGAVQPEPRMLALPGPRLIFTGQMDYAPNVAAVVRAAERLLPALRERFPGASLHIVGRNPVVAVQALDRLPGCQVWGGVPDMRTWLAAADAAVVPLELARGVQNKVLEAMAMALPVVLTCEAATGIAATPGRDFAIADNDAGLIAAISGLFASPAAARAMGQAARLYVIERQSWAAALAPLDDLIATPVGPDTRDAA
jgi:polysaccharide biosynthesis protein PslH